MILVEYFKDSDFFFKKARLIILFLHLGSNAKVTGLLPTSGNNSNHLLTPSCRATSRRFLTTSSTMLTMTTLSTTRRQNLDWIWIGVDVDDQSFDRKLITLKSFPHFWRLRWWVESNNLAISNDPVVKAVAWRAKGLGSIPALSYSFFSPWVARKGITYQSKFVLCKSIQVEVKYSCLCCLGQ